MQIRILLILLAISLALAFTKRWRIVGLVASTVLALLLVWFIVSQPVTQQDAGMSPAISSSSATARVLPVVPVVTLQLEGNGAPWRLSGTVANPGDVPIRSITLNLERLDCPSPESVQADCDLVWRGQHTLRKSISAATSARIDDSFYSHETLARLKGVPRDHITVITVQ